MTTKRFILLMTLALTAGMMHAQDPVEIGNFPLAEDTLIASADTIATDTIESIPDPEWYVAPISYDSVMARHNAPRRAAANTCTKPDSVQTFNEDSILKYVSIYEYGDTVRTIKWKVYPDGSREGDTKTELSNDGYTFYGASYTWDNTINDWKGKNKADTIYNEAHKMTSRTIYAWVNYAWVPDTKYTYSYDTSNRETEFTTYTRNSSTNQLVLSKQRTREYNAKGKTTLDIQYTAHNGTSWSAGTKKVYDYDASGNQILYEYYSSYNNGNWVGANKEIWEYISGKKTLYELYLWSNNNWSNSSREIWEYNGPSSKQTLYEKYTASGDTWIKSSKEIWEYNGPANKQTLHEKYSGSNNEWSLSLQENSGYDVAGNNNLVENYNVNNGTFTGSKKEEYTFKGTKKIVTIKYKWSNGAFVNNTKAVSDVDDAGNSIETANYNWKNDAWVGNGTRTLQTFNSNKKVTEKITQNWPTSATDWVNKTCTTTVYTGTKVTQETYYTWSNDAWLGTNRNDYHYNAKNQNDTIKTYTNNGTDWIYSNRTVNTYDASGLNVMTHNAKWENSTWIMTTMTRTDIIKDVAGRQLLKASWRCNADSLWIGVQKDTATYSATGKELNSAHYTGWANNDWVPTYKVESEYDEADHEILSQRLDWKNNQWQGNYRYEYLYDQSGRQIMAAVYSSWNITLSNWVGSTKSVMEYNDAGQNISMVNYSWINNNWKESSKNLFVYDAANHVIDQIVQSYNDNNKSWDNSLRYEKGYKGSQLIKSNDYTWLNHAWQFTRRNETYYDEDAQAKLRRKVYGLWSEGVNLSFADDHYFYACDAKTYTIRFVNYNGVELSSQQVAEGETPTYGGETPTKPANDQYTYTFKGWTPALTEVTGNATYTADFDSVAKTYTIRFVDEDNTELQSSSVEYGQTPVYTGSTPEKESTAEFTYSFAGWMPEIVSVTADATYTATYTATKRSYTIIWLDSDDTQIEQQTLEYGTTPSHEAPVRENTEEYSYVFLGWTPEIATVTGDGTYTALFSVTKNSYIITWLNLDNSLIEQQTLEYGLTPSHEAPVKENTVQYTYSFAGWTPDIVAVSGDATYTAQFDSVVNKYPISFLNYDGAELQKSSVEFGQTPAYTGATPVKPNTAQYTYSFKGWDSDIVAVIGEATYTAEFDSILNSYTITWQDENGAELSHETLAYGATPSHDDPAKTNTAEFTYAFTGWTPQIAAVTGDATYRATFSATKNKYAVSFLNYDGTELQNSSVEFGQTPAYTGATPSKPATAQYTYTFTGWSPQIASVSGEATYIAQYDSVINSYTVIFYYEDGYTELDRMTLQYGETPSTVGVPSKLSDIQYTYHFAGWSPEIAPVTGDVAYTPVYDTVLNQYPITFKNYNGRVLKTVMTDYGTIPEYTGETPDKPATAQYSFIFAGWTPELTEVTGAATYTAIFESELNVYTITFFDEDGTQLDQVIVEYGTMPTTDIIPTKPEDEEYTYTFAGWTPRLVKVTSDASYWATYTATKKTEGLSPVTGNPSPVTVKVLIDGTIYIRRGSHLYTLDGVLVE